MKLEEYQALALRTARMFPTDIENLNHAALGLASEFFEVCAADGPDQQKEEIGDCAWYMALACHALNANFHDLFQSPLLDFDVETPIAALKDFISEVKGLVVYNRTLDDERRQDMLEDLEKFAYTLRCFEVDSDTPIVDVLEQNIAKLRKRFPDAYSHELADARIDKGGVDSRNS